MRIPESVRRNCARFEFNAPATEVEVAACERQLETRLPADLRQFLLESAGGTGWVGDAYVMLWDPAMIAENQKLLEVDEFMPGALLFGSDGGGSFFAYVDVGSERKIVLVPDSLERRFAVDCASSILEFLSLRDPMRLAERLRNAGSGSAADPEDS